MFSQKEKLPLPTKIKTPLRQIIGKTSIVQE